MELFAEQRPDILLLDLMMPEVSGFDILAQIRAHEELRYTPVIILTAESDPVAKLKALELGATDLLTKPVDPSELRLRLRNALAFKSLSGSSGRLRCAHRVAESSQVPLGPLDAASAAHAAVARLRAAAHRPGPVQDRSTTPSVIALGDKLLCAVAQLLERTLSMPRPPGGRRSREPGVQRLRCRASAGNGFAALLPNLHNLKKVDTADSIARRVLVGFRDPFHIDEHELFVTASIGIAVSPGDGQEAEALLKHAEMAMYQAKKRGENTYEFLSGEMNAHALERLTLENQLRRAVERNEFVLFYQPKVDIAAGASRARKRWCAGSTRNAVSSRPRSSSRSQRRRA